MTATIIIFILTCVLAALVVVLAIALLRLRERVSHLATDAVGGHDRQANLQELLSATTDGLVAWRFGRIVEANGVLETVGKARGPAAAAFTALHEWFHEDDRTLLNTAITALHDGGDPEPFTLRGADGTAWYQVTLRKMGQDEDIYALWLRENSEIADRAKQLQQLVEQSHQTEQALAKFVNQVPVPLYRRDKDLAIIWCNQAYAEMAGLESPDDTDKLRRAEIETGMTRDAGRRLAGRARDSGTMQREIRHYVYNGQRRALLVVEFPNHDDGGLIGYLRDVTDTEEKDGELRRHIDANAEVLNNLSTAITIYGSDQRLNYYNEAHAKLWELSEEWLAGGPTFGEVLDRLREERKLPEVTDFPAYKTARLQNFTDLLQTQEDVLYLPDGRVLRNVTSPHPFGGLMILAEDITDSLVLERSVNTMTAVQRETLDNLYEGVAVFGADAQLKLFNAAFARMWDVSASQMNNEPHVSMIVQAAKPWLARSDDEDEWAALQARLLSQVTSRENMAGRMQGPKQSVIDYSSVALPDGNKLFTYLDVTDSVAVEHALRERNLALEAADQIKSEFLASVSYELRTPLNVIIGFAEVLVNQYFGELNDQQLEYGQDILNSSQQLLALINDILDLASIEAGRLELEPAEIEVQDLLESVVALARERAQRGQLSLTLEMEENIGILQADEKRIKQVLFNLLTNALKYTDPGGKVTIGVNREGETMSFYVSDTGVGIAEEDRELIFESFSQGRRANVEHSAGLGLSLVKRFVELHNGSLDLQSKLGEGTTVRIFLPMRQTAPLEPPTDQIDRETAAP